MHSLEEFGWDESLARDYESYLEREAAEAVEPARVTWQIREHYRLQTAGGERPALPTGTMRHRAELPVVGDWVVYESRTERIAHVLPRRSKLSRKVAGDRTVEQVVAANIDIVLIVAGLDGDFSTRRLERMVTMAHESGATPVVVLNKSDLEVDVEVLHEKAVGVSPGIAVVAISAKLGSGLDELTPLLTPGRTAILVGSSGVGKSTLLNRLVGEEVMATRDVREHDDRGRHTTTHRQLIRLPGGGLMIDNPGIRELQLWVDDEPALEDAFADVLELAGECRFRDCGHQREPGCAVQGAVSAGGLKADRLAGYRKLEHEQRHLAMKRDEAGRRKVERKQGQFYKSVQSDKKKRR